MNKLYPKCFNIVIEMYSNYWECSECGYVRDFRPFKRDKVYDK